MASIDTRVVEMRFNNAQFEQGAQQTLRTLNALKSAMKLEGATKGLSDLSAAGSKVNLSHIGAGAEAVAGKLKAMSVVGITALATLTTKAISTGAQIAKSLTIAPVTGGFHEYETKLNSIQTILANTASAGTNLKQVTATLDELNHYADQTIYNFAEMAKNIGTFTAAGVDLKTATGAIKGIANLAALSGSNSQQASTAMYQLSQAISAGTVTLEDWNSVVNAGMGGTVFQRALAQTAVSMGKLEKGALKLTGPMKNVTINGEAFRKSISAVNGESWLTGDVLTRTLQQFTGDLSDAELKAQGFSDAQIKAIQKQAQMAKHAATEVKTLSGLYDTLKESVGSSWASTWETIIGDFEEAKSLWTGVNEVVGGFIQKSSDARNKVLSDWKALGGRTALIQAISNTFNGLLGVLRPIKDAFREIFPPTTGKQLYDMTVALRDFTEKLKVGGETANRIKRTFAGVFAVFGIGWDIVKELAGMLFRLFGVVGDGSGGFLKTTASIGDFLVKVRETLHKGDALHKFFLGLGKVLAVPIKILQFFGKLIGSIFDGFSAGKAGKAAGDAVKKFEPFKKLGELLAKLWDKVLSLLDDVSSKFAPIAEKLGEFFEGFGEKIGSIFDNFDFGDLLSAINTGAFAGLILLLRNFISNLGSIGEGGGFLEGIKDGIESVTDTFGAMQNTLRATTLLQIAIAIGILALALDKLSKIDGKGLTRSLTAMGVMFTQLMSSMLIFEKLSGFTGFAKMPFIAASMILLSIAVNVLASAVKKLADLNWNELAKGLVGVGVLLAMLVGVMKFMPRGPSLIFTSLGILVLAGAVHVLASAVKKFSGLSWSEIARGLTAMAGALLVVGAALNFVSPKSAISSVGILVVAVSLGMIAGALKKMSEMSWGEILKGLVSMLGALTIITAALVIVPPNAALGAAGILIAAISLGLVAKQLKVFGDMEWGQIVKGLVTMFGALLIMTAALTIIPPHALLGAAGLLVAAISLGFVADALKKLGDMSWGEIAKSLVLLAASLTIIAVAVTLMIAALPGAVALLVIAGSLAVLAPILKMFSEMSWGEILKGLVMLAGTFFVLGAAGLILAPVVPILLLLGAAITLIGVGILAAGAGVLLFATALTALAAAGGAATLVIVGMISAIAGTIPLVMKKIGEGIVAFAGAIEQGAPAIVNAIVAVLMALLNAMEKLIPKIVNVLYKMLSKMLDTMQKYVPKMTDAGLRLLIGILNGISKNIGRVTDAATRVMVGFLNGISRNLPKVVQAGANLIIKFVNSVANAIRANSPAMGAAGANLASAIIEGMARGLMAGIGTITARAREVAQSALNAAKGALGIHSPSKEFYKIGKYVNDGFAKGLRGNKKQIDSAFGSLKGQISSAYKDSAKDIEKYKAQLTRIYKRGVVSDQELNRTKKALAQAKKEHKAEYAAYQYLTRSLNDERTALGKLANKYDVLTPKVEEARKVLEDATKTRDDYNKSIVDQYGTLPSIGMETRLGPFVKDLQKQIEDTKNLSTMLQQLRGLGLNDALYKQILSAGTSAIPFVKQLLASGKNGVDEVNRLGKDLDTAAVGLGKQASTALYQAAVDAAAGLVKGLENQQAAIKKQMDKIADYMVKAMKKKLGIKSPSREFAKIGGYSLEGLAQGLKQTAIVENAAGSAGQTALDTLRKTLSGFNYILDEHIDSTPTITPVLDLTDVEKNAGRLGSMLSSATVSVSGTYSRAKVAYDSHLDNKSAVAEERQAVLSGSVSFTQINNSPKALSPAEVYRQTKNQLSVAKGVLTNNANAG